MSGISFAAMVFAVSAIWFAVSAAASLAEGSVVGACPRVAASAAAFYRNALPCEKRSSSLRSTVPELSMSISRKICSVCAAV